MTVLSDPNIAFLLFVAGLAGILVEFVHPSLVSGLIGAVCLVLAFVGFASLPLNVAGLVLIAFGMLLFALESQITSHGLLAVGGLIVFVAGASMLYSAPPGHVVAVSVPVIAITAALFAAFMGGVIYAAMRTRQMAAPRGTVGTPIPIGTSGVVQAPLAPQGTVHLAGETWTARSADGSPLGRDTPVRLVAFDGLVAIVTPEAAPPPARP